MKTLFPQFLLCALVTVSLGACGNNPPKPVLPDGSHRVPVNATPPTGVRS